MAALSRRVLLGCVVAVAAQFASAFEAPPLETPHIHVKNFGQVNDRVYRGAEPDPVALEELAGMGIKTVVDLRETSEATAFEKQTVEKLGMTYWNIPFRPASAPSDEQVYRVLALLQAGNDPVFVHCRRGKDRTGTVVACYRIQHDGWDNRKALTEANQYGMSSLERGMRAYIARFRAQTGI